jgi:hypothetical protein
MADDAVDWVASTARLPLAFAHVREDPWIDARVLELLGECPDVLMIASVVAPRAGKPFGARLDPSG